MIVGLSENNPVTLNLALCMEAAGWSTADQWLKQETAYDLAQACKRLNQPPAPAPAVLRKKQLATEAAAAAA